MKKFSIPGYFSRFNECKALLEYYKTHYSYFYEDRAIDSSYDLPGGLIWNGGRVKWHTGYDPYEMHDIMNYYFNETNIRLRHTCTNSLITGSLVEDWTCNLFLDQYMRDKDSIIVASQDLYDYLSKKYSPMQLIYSTTLGITDIETINEITKDHIYVIDYTFNNDNEYLRKLKYPQNIEIVCAEPCVLNCPYRVDHYKEISKGQLGLIEFENKNQGNCNYGIEDISFTDMQKLPQAISNERVDELYNMGIQNFKISGRSIPSPRWIEIITYYLVKPEYVDKVRFDLLNQLW